MHVYRKTKDWRSFYQLARFHLKPIRKKAELRWWGNQDFFGESCQVVQCFPSWEGCPPSTPDQVEGTSKESLVKRGLSSGRRNWRIVLVKCILNWKNLWVCPRVCMMSLWKKLTLVPWSQGRRKVPCCCMDFPARRSNGEIPIGAQWRADWWKIVSPAFRGKDTKSSLETLGVTEASRGA